MSPIGENFILIGAGRDFFSMGKTILIMREKVQYIPSSLIPKNSISSKRKACSHFCRNDGLYCCICAKRTDICELCLSSVKHKQIEAEKQKAAYTNRNQVIENLKSNTVPEPEKRKEDLNVQSEELLEKVQQKMGTKSKDNSEKNQVNTQKSKKTSKKQANKRRTKKTRKSRKRKK